MKNIKIQIILIVAFITALSGQTPIKDFDRKVDTARRIQTGFILLSAIGAIGAYDRAQSGKTDDHLFYFALSTAVISVAVPPVMVRNALIKFNQSQVKMEVSF